MKKLHLNKIFHWLYAFLMFYPILAFFCTIIIASFNGNLNLNGLSISELSRGFWSIVDNCTFAFAEGSAGEQIANVYSFVINDVLGPEDTDNSSMIINLLSYWTSVSLVYLIFDVLMYPINLFHKWIDEGGF